MIAFTICETGPRVAIVCDSCGKTIDRSADGLVVRWAGSSALVCHAGACLDVLRLQYPSTVREPVIELVDALEQLSETNASPRRPPHETA